MFPMIIDTSKMKVALVGEGPATARRLELLQAAGSTPLQLKTIADKAVVSDCDVVFIADFDDEESERLYNVAKGAGALVNVEDKREWCDFHVPAIVRRGDLLLTVSTNASSPRLARRIRHMLEVLFPESWIARLDEIRENREQWKANGATFQELAEKTDDLLDSKGWLKKDCACMQAGRLN